MNIVEILLRLGAGHRSGRSIVPRAATGERKTDGHIQEKVWPVIRSKNNAWCAGQNFSRNLKGPERELYCTKKCRTKTNNAVRYAKIKKDLQKRICVVCLKEFEPVRYRPDQLATCSKECNLQRQNKIRRNGTDAPDQRECRECQTVKPKNSQSSLLF